MRAGLLIVRSLVLQESHWWVGCRVHCEVVRGRLRVMPGGWRGCGRAEAEAGCRESAWVLMRRCSVFCQRSMQELEAGV